MRLAAFLALLLPGCAPDEAKPLSQHSFAFAVFGDGPYSRWETGRFADLIADVNRADVEWFLHVGDVLSGDCSDTALAQSLRALSTIRHPVVYTPGDNEWTDCHRGSFDPLERLRRIRQTYFSDPSRSTTGAAMRVESQGTNPQWKEFAENARWRRGGFLFVTAHFVGSWNGARLFRGRTAAHDSAVVRRTAAGLEWIDSAFAIARAESLSGIVIAFHADPRFYDNVRNPFAGLLARLAEQSAAFPGQVLLIHGDSHDYIVDHPLKDTRTGKTLENFIRLETYGSPDIGWVRVVIDSVAGKVVDFEPRLMRGVGFP